jgi:hypothetical protein
MYYNGNLGCLIFKTWSFVDSISQFYLVTPYWKWFLRKIMNEEQKIF